MRSAIPATPSRTLHFGLQPSPNGIESFSEGLGRSRPYPGKRTPPTTKPTLKGLDLNQPSPIKNTSPPHSPLDVRRSAIARLLNSRPNENLRVLASWREIKTSKKQELPPALFILAFRPIPTGLNHSAKGWAAHGPTLVTAPPPKSFFNTEGVGSNRLHHP